MSTPDPSQDRAGGDPVGGDFAEREPAAAPKPAPTIAQHLKWSALMILIVVLLARIATPILRWLGFE